MDFLVKIILGKEGRTLLSFFTQYKYVLIILFILYGLLLLYAKYIYTVVLVKELEKYVVENCQTKKSSEIYEDWQTKKKGMKWYILVPTKNELFVQHVSKAGNNISLLQYNKKRYQYDETEKIEEIIKTI